MTSPDGTKSGTESNSGSPKNPDAATTSTPAIDIRNLTVKLGGQIVLESIDLMVPERDFLGIIGPNGAGKTVLLRVLLGLIPPDQGSVRIFGRRVEQARGDLAYVPQFASFDQRFPIRVLEVVLMSRLGRSAMRHRYSQVDRDRAMAALEQVNLADLARRQIGKLSGGQLQRVLIARALAVEARILLLDEPTASLDTKISGSLYDLLTDLSERMTLVMVGHDIGVMHRHVKTVACLNRTLFCHTAGDVTEEMLQKAYGGPVDVLLHPHTHRMLGEHEEED